MPIINDTKTIVQESYGDLTTTPLEEEPVGGFTTLESISLEPKVDDQVVLRTLQQGAGSKLDADTVRGEIITSQSIAAAGATDTFARLLALLF